jgi:hypothetical protein
VLVTAGISDSTPARIWDVSDPSRLRPLPVPLIWYSAADDEPTNASFAFSGHLLAVVRSGWIQL